MKFVPYEELGDQPNIIVDGAGNAHTSITLSHWPNSGTPDVLKDDISTQIVFHYLDRPELWVNAEYVSNNHFDEDGLVGIYTLLHPLKARQQRDLIIDIAAAGDFGTYRFRDAARTTFVLSAFSDPDRSPLDAGIFRQRYPRMASMLYQEMLPRLPEIVADLDRFRAYWESEDAWLDQSESLIRERRIQIEEIPALDLAVVTLAADQKLHPMALHNAIHSFRVLLMQGRKYEFQYRYESWVQYISKKPLPRIDLGPLAKALSELESGNGRWMFDGVDEIVPKLALTDAEESGIPPAEFRARIIKGLS